MKVYTYIFLALFVITQLCICQFAFVEYDAVFESDVFPYKSHYRTTFLSELTHCSIKFSKNLTYVLIVCTYLLLVIYDPLTRFLTNKKLPGVLMEARRSARLAQKALDKSM